MSGLTMLVVGDDPHGLGEELEALDVTITRVAVPVTGETMTDAGLADAAVVVVTEMSEAAALAVAKEHNPAVRAVTYSGRSLPAYAARVTDLAVDPDLVPVGVVAEELVAEATGEGVGTAPEEATD
ncbi:DUF7126 family protein [Halorubrum vacuolatum]|uniref:CTP synthetase n=1 Tax=Halorubrum vacuolatum TaxID=63740 RepID=A0A238WEA2_HALVU|nr:hypothetical protein [Halorubrum vacuolatum]SNR44916.1 hypothetical protein SAMN06264855_10776 [Halorubrum vacuolatum]